MKERGDRSEGQIKKMRRGDVRDSGHNRDMGDSAIAEIVLPKKRQNFHLKTAIRQGLYLHLYYIRENLFLQKNRLRTRKRGLIV
jgi:hypothetical protein